MAILDGDILRVSVNFELAGPVQYQNIYYYTRDGTDPFSDAIHIAAIEVAMEAAYDEIVGQTPSSVVEQLSFVDRLEWDGTKWEITENIGTFTPNFVPVGSGDQLPFQSSPFVIFKTERPRSVGKKFLFPFTETTQNETVLVGSAVTAIAAYAAVILTPIAVGGDATLTAGIVRTGVNTWLNFLTAVVNDILGTQRRRRPGVGA